MVIYEVNLTIKNEIFNDYYHWLVQHIEIMLRLPGFKKAEISKERLADTDTESTKLTVHYTLASEQALDDYLTNHSSTMRDEGINKFGDKFTAFRRILKRVSVMRANETV